MLSHVRELCLTITKYVDPCPYTTYNWLLSTTLDTDACQSLLKCKIVTDAGSVCVPRLWIA